MNISVANGGAEEPQRGEQYKPPSPTGHFEQRRVQGDRPTGQAFSEVRENTMEILVTEDVASVTLFTIKLSESEMQAYESCIAYVLTHLSHAEIEKITGHMRDELEEVHQELRTAILTHCPKQFLPERYKV